MTAAPKITGEVHPVADLFPLLPEDELKDLAADIAERGLLQPIVLDMEGRILDGRNRYAACAIAGIEPEAVVYGGDDPEGYALAVNLARRHMTPGGRAMVAAKAARLPGMTIRRVAAGTDLYHTRIAEALAVLDWCDVATQNDVLTGSLALSVAVERARKAKAEDGARKAKRERLTRGAPDLLGSVDDGRITLDDGIAALDAREEKARQEAAERAERKRQEAIEKATKAEQDRLARESERRVATENLNRVALFLTSEALTPEVFARQEYGAVLDRFDIRRLRYMAAALAAIVRLKEES